MFVDFVVEADEFELVADVGQEGLSDVVPGELSGLEEGDLNAFLAEQSSSVGTGGASTDDEDLGVRGL